MFTELLSVTELLAFSAIPAWLITAALGIPSIYVLCFSALNIRWILQGVPPMPWSVSYHWLWWKGLI